MLLAALGTSIANVGLPALAEAFHAAFQDIQWVVLAYLLAVTACIVGVGRLGDLIGRRRLMLAGIMLFTVASTLCAVAPTLWLLIAARAVQGLGAAIMMALTLALVTAVVPPARTGSAMGLLGTMSAIGTTLGSALGGLLVAGCGWRALFLINLPLGLVALLLAWRHLPIESRRLTAARPTFDHLGTLLLALTLTAYALAVTLGRGNFGPLNLALLIAASLGLCLFLHIEARVASPLIRLALFRDPGLSAGFALNVLVATVVMTTLVVGPFYLSGAFTLTPSQVGLALACGPLVSTLTGIPAGRLVDRFGSYRITLLGLAAMATGSGLMALMPLRSGVLGYIAPLVILTAGYALFQAANNTAVMTAIQPDQRGLISGLLNLSRNLGLITGAAVMGAVFAWGAGTGHQALAEPAAAARGLESAFSLAALLIVSALGIAIRSRARTQRTAAHGGGESSLSIEPATATCSRRL
jgi:EmrB/QacA subfamily drug resistance transporter